MNPAILELKNITKDYHGTRALDDVSITLEKGEIHGLVGENGAGKSTLTKIMCGAVQPTRGSIRLRGEKMDFASPIAALNAGVAMVFQETSLIPSLTVAQNLYLRDGKYFNRLRPLYIAAQTFLQSLSFKVDPARTIESLGAAQRQMVEIARAVLHDASIIVFDEPTATLTPEEKRYFFSLVRQLRDEGVTIVFISHALEEALELCDRITVLRDGEQIFTRATQTLSREQLVQAMIGRHVQELGKPGGQPTKTRGRGRRVLSVQNLSMGNMVRNNTFSIYAGQVTGMFGLVGSGRTETAKVVAGVRKRNFLHGGEIVFEGKRVRYRMPGAAIKDGIVYLTEDRKVEGIYDNFTVGNNLYLGWLAKHRRSVSLVSARERSKLADFWVSKLGVKIASNLTKMIELSGGNQQKVVFGKALVQDPHILILDEPTRGVDVGTISEIHETIAELADDGMAIWVISSYLPEVLSLSDRILVMRDGRVVEEFSQDEASEEMIMYAAVH